MASTRRPRGALEQEVLAALGTKKGGPMTAREVLAAMDGDLAYTTILTVLVRLHGKGAVTREPVGRAFAYRKA